MADAPPDLLTAAPGREPRTVRFESGATAAVPDGWELLPPGDAGLTRRVKAAGKAWTVEEKKGRKRFSRGVWAPAATIAAAEAALEAERATPEYARKQASAAKRRDKEQAEYVEDFCGAVRNFLGFAPEYAELARRLAAAVTAHATPVGSGTVARTERIPVERRAEAAVLAWMRHQTTGYDDLTIARVKGKRREVRRDLAGESRRILATYRAGGRGPSAGCPLAAALATIDAPPAPKPPALGRDNVPFFARRRILSEPEA